MIALIGFGYWGKVYFKYLNHKKKIYIYTKNPVNIKKNEYKNCVFTSDLNKIINNPKISHIFVVTPIETHFEISKKFLFKKKKVLSEKPIILNKKQSELINYKFKNNLFVSYPYNYSKIIQKAKIISKKYKLGAPKFISINFSQAGRFNNNSVFQLIGPHVISISSQFFNLENFSIKKKNTNLFSKKNETGIYEISKNRKIYIKAFISTNYLFKKKKEIIIFFKNSNIFCDLTKSQKNIILRKYKREKIKTYDYAKINFEKIFSIKDKDNIKSVIDDFLKNNVNFKKNIKLTYLINKNI